MTTESREPTGTIADFDETENRQPDAADGLLTRDNENDDVSYKKDDAASGQHYGDRVQVYWFNRSNRVLRRRRK